MHLSINCNACTKPAAAHRWLFQIGLGTKEKWGEKRGKWGCCAFVQPGGELVCVCGFCICFDCFCCRQVVLCSSVIAHSCIPAVCPQNTQCPDSFANVRMFLVQADVCLYIHWYICYVCVCVCVHIYIICVCVCVCVCVCCAYVCVHVHVYIFTCTGV